MQQPDENGRRIYTPQPAPAAVYETNNADVPEQVYDNPGYSYRGQPGMVTRYPGDFGIFPPSGRYSLNSSDERRYYKKKDNNSRKQCIIIAIIVAIVVVILGVTGAIVGVALSDRESSSDKQTATPGPTKIVTQSYPGEATLTGLTFSDDYNDPTSAKYRQAEQDFKSKMDNKFRQGSLSEKYSATQVEGFREGSLIIMFSVIFQASVPQTSTNAGVNVDLSVVVQIVQDIDIVDTAAVTVASLCDSSPCNNGGTCQGGVNSYSCLCRSGYTGTSCNADINECASNPCQNNGVCTNQLNQYTCTCPPGFEGIRCQTDIDYCDPNPCQHGGTCDDGTTSYTCTCRPGYVGNNCQTDVNECASSPCQNGGSCVNEVNKFTCDCVDGYTGNICQTDVNECGSSPCENGGQCADGVNFYSCECLDGFMGDNCQTDIDECAVNPCRNGATCEDKINSYSCACVSGYTGNICQTEINECESSPCRNGGSCTDALNAYSCTCLDGYSGAQCEMITDPCVSGPCKNGGICSNSGNSEYMCICKAEFIGKQCERVVTTIPSTRSPTTVRPPITIPPVTFITCSDGFENVETWFKLNYNYNSNLQNNTSEDYMEQYNFVTSVIAALFVEDSPIVSHVGIVAFQRLNGSTSSVSTVQACMTELLTDKRSMYDVVIEADLSAFGAGFIGLEFANQMPTDGRPVNFTCPFTYHTCSEEVLCIPEEFLCDGTTDCQTGEDEVPETCLQGNLTTTERQPTETTTEADTTTGTTTPESCSDDEFQCYTYYECIGKTLVCDGSRDCEDSSDEWFCPTTPRPRPSELEVRLMNGNTDTSLQGFGRVEVRPNDGDSPWGTVCDDMFGIEEATVICKQLGLSGQAYPFTGATFGEGTGPIYIGSLRCTGTESGLLECGSTADWGYIHCAHNQDAAVSCGFEATTQPSVVTSTDSMATAEVRKVRLVAGDSCLGGVLEVMVNNQWGTVCDDLFGRKEADVVCKMLGFRGAADYGNFLFSHPSSDDLPILMDDVDCDGDENSIFDCEYIREHNCGHYEDIGIECAGDPTIACYKGPIPESVDCDFNLHHCQYVAEPITGSASWGQDNHPGFNAEDGFMYLADMEGSARLISPTFYGSWKEQHVEFMYYIQNSQYNNLVLSLTTKATNPNTADVSSEIWNSEYLVDADTKWIYHCENLATLEENNYNLIFEGRTDMDVTIGLDNIKVSPGTCKGLLLDGPCTFDHPFKCGVTLECNQCRRNVLTYRWYWTDDGPDEDSGMLIHANSVFGEEGDTAVATFTLPYVERGWSVRYRVHMSGLDTGMLKISLTINGDDFTLETLRGRQGNGWFYRCTKMIDVILKEGYDIDLNVEAIRGAGPHGDIYIDDVEIVPSMSCASTANDWNTSWQIANPAGEYMWEFLEQTPLPLVRLVGGDYSYGLVEVYHDGEYRGICQQIYSYYLPDIICQMIGFEWGIYYAETSNTTFWLKDVECEGTEDTILECPGADIGETENCTEDDHMYVYCFGDEFTPERQPAFERNFFRIFQSKPEIGSWSSLISYTMKGDDSPVPMTFMFDISKTSADVLKIYLKEETSDTSKVIGKIIENYEIKTVCFEYMTPATDYTIEIMAIRDSKSTDSPLEISKFAFQHGYCQGVPGVCDFQSEFTGCAYSVTNSQPTSCLNTYEWRKTRATSPLYDYTLKNSLGQFMYIDNLLVVNPNLEWSILQLSIHDKRQNALPFACSVKFAYFVNGTGILTANDIAFAPAPSVHRMWRQGCVRINPSGSCPLKMDTVSIEFKANGVEAGVDDVYISADECPSTINITCEFDHGEDCGYSWTSNLTIVDGMIVNTGEPGNFTIMSGVFASTSTDICITVENSDYIVHNLSAAVFKLNGDVQNITFVDYVDSDVFLELDVKTTVGEEYVLLIEGVKYPNQFVNVFLQTLGTYTVSVDSVRMFSGKCSSIVKPCRKSQMECGDGTCALKSNICDGKRDCTNGVDEQMCNCYSDDNLVPLLNCTRAGCIPSSLHCDGTPDCRDGSDELSCEPTIQCMFDDQFICGYSTNNAHRDMYTNTIRIMPLFGLLESPEVSITTEQCLTVAFTYSHATYSAHTSFWVLNTLALQTFVLAKIDIPLPLEYDDNDRQTGDTDVDNGNDMTSPLPEMDYDIEEDQLNGYKNDSLKWLTKSMTLPRGTYKIVFEVHGLYVDIKEVSVTSGACPATTQRPPSTSETTHSTTTTTKPTDVPRPDGFPTIVAEQESVNSYYGESVDISCIVHMTEEYEGTLFWYSQDGEVIARNSDIMLEDENQQQYTVGEDTLDTNRIRYTLTINSVSPQDTNMRYHCFLSVFGYQDVPVQASVYLSTPVPESTTCVPNPIAACAESGFEFYKLPSLSGIRYHSQVQQRLLDIFYHNSWEPMEACHTALRNLSCGIHAPACVDDNLTPICRDSCEDIASACQGNFPSIVYNSNADIDHFCKFLDPNDNRCKRINFECGSHINTSSMEFHFQSDLSDSEVCSYKISGPPSEKYFKWLEVTFESIDFGGQTCDISNVTIGDDVLCPGTVLPIVKTVQKPTVDITLFRSAGNDGAFRVSVKIVNPTGLCDIYTVPENFSQIEATQYHQCSRWIITLHPDLHKENILQLDVLTLDGGCIELDNNTGLGTRQVCETGKIVLDTKNVTVLRPATNVIFTLDYTAVLESDLEDNLNPDLVPIKVELVDGDREGSGLVQIYRADGLSGIVCSFTFTTMPYLCGLMGYMPILEDYEFSDHLPEGYDIVATFVECVDVDNITECEVTWIDSCYQCSCFNGQARVYCRLPTTGTVACDFTEDQCGYQITDDDSSKTLVSPMFTYHEATSVNLVLNQRGEVGDIITVSLLDNGILSEIWTSWSADTGFYHVFQGDYTVCLPLPVEKQGRDVQITIHLTFGGVSSNPMFGVRTLELNADNCQEVFPQSPCSFDNLDVCLPLIDSLCPTNSVWKVSQGQLIGDAKHSTMEESNAISFGLPDYSFTPNTQYMRFHYVNTGQLYDGNIIEFMVQHQVGVSAKTTLFESSSSAEYGEIVCVPIKSIAAQGNTIYLVLTSSSSMGYVFIDDLYVNDVKCPHHASCNFDTPCPITIHNTEDDILHWNITDADLYNVDANGHYISLVDNTTVLGGEEASFSLQADGISTFQCLSFRYTTYHTQSPDVLIPFLYVSLNYSSSSGNTVKTFGVVEYLQYRDWTEAQVPVDPDFGGNVTITFNVKKLFDDSQIYMYLDDIILDASDCKYGIENMDMCSFDEPMKCLLTDATDAGSGYFWELHRELESTESDAYIQVESSYGKEGARSYLWFDVDMESESTNLYYQFRVMSEDEPGSLDTFLETNDPISRKRKKRAIQNLYNVPLQGSGIWYLSDCYTIPSGFKGQIGFLATRGQNHNGVIALDNVQINRDTCREPKVACSFDVEGCGYTTDMDWTRDDKGFSSQTQGARLYVPIQKLTYEESCLLIVFVPVEETASLNVHIAMETETKLLKSPKQVNVSRRKVKSIMFAPAMNKSVTITSVIENAGSCSLPACVSTEFACEEKCIEQSRQCDGIEDCYAGLDEANCGFSLACEFTTDLCDYEDVSNSWTRTSSFAYKDSDGNSMQIQYSPDNELLVTSFSEYTIAKSTIQSKVTKVTTESCLAIRYTGTVASLTASVEYEDGNVTHWNDSSVKGDNTALKTGMIDIAVGRVKTSFTTSMLTKKDGLPHLLLDSFLIIESIKVVAGKCEQTTHPGCPDGTELCADRSVCYPLDWFCDNVDQCPDGSDESLARCLPENSLECTFEEPNMCFYQPLTHSTNYLWVREKVMDNELPTADHTLGNSSGHFMYHSHISDLEGIVYNATIQSVPVRFNQDSCVQFWYFMNASRLQTKSLTAQLFVSLVYYDEEAVTENLLWYDSVDRPFTTWIRGAIPVDGNRVLRLQLVAKTYNPVEVWPGLVAVDGIEVTEGACPITQDCRPNSFECTFPKVCIPKYFLCDGTAHCSDGSDERSCDKPDGEFDVIGGDGSYGQARVFLDSAWRPVCKPFDEDIPYMAAAVCRRLGFRGLAEGFAYPNPDTNQQSVKLDCVSENQCDFEVSSCEFRLGIKCSNAVCFAGERQCPGSRFECIPESHFCDGLPDCTDFSDEKNCGNCSSKGQFECQNHKCVPISARCNGIEECSDGTDEHQCVQVDDSGVTVWDRHTLSRRPVCISEINRETADRICRLAGSGYFQVPGIEMGREKVENGILIYESVDPSKGTLLPGLDVVSNQPQQCYPLHVACALPECGTTAYQEERVESYIFHGDEAVLGEWPWHCSLFADEYFYCGCSYIGQNYILTAAHCIPPPSYQISITIGTISTEDIGPYGQRINATRAIVHPDYRDFFPEIYDIFYSDIAILELPTAPIIDNYTRPICLADMDDMAYFLSLGASAECYVIGMGSTEKYNYVIDDDVRPLAKHRVTLVDHEKCNQTYVDLLDFSMYLDTVCVQSHAPYSPVCSGDSGGSLICKDARNGHWKEIGVTSFGLSGCYAHIFPDAYNSVPMFIDWISDVTGIKFNKP